MEALGRQLWLEKESSKEKSSTRNRFVKYQRDPVKFCSEVLGLKLWEKQEQILRSVADNTYTAVRSCHGAGKTFTAAAAAIWFLQCFPDSCVITTAPSGRQVRDLLWRQIRANFEKSATRLSGRCMTTMIDVTPDWYATGFATDEPVNFQGPHSPAGVLFVGDEASGLAEWVFDTARGFMTQNNAKMLLIGNPNMASGSFYEAFLGSRWEQIHISAFDVPEWQLRPDWKVEMLEDFGEDNPIYQVRVLGEFPTQGQNALISMEWVEEAQRRVVEEGTPCEFGVDIARYGDDKSYCYVRKGNKIVFGKEWSGKDTVQSAGIVVQLARQFWPDRIKVDEIGIGTSVLDQLKHEGWPVVGVNSNAQPRSRADYFNLRSELYADLARRFQLGEISVPAGDKILKGQLVSLTYEHTQKGQRKLIGKEELKKAGKKSPDRADALMLCFAGSLGGYVARGLAVARRGGREAVGWGGFREPSSALRQGDTEGFGSGLRSRPGRFRGGRRVD